jgi:hypothetical protein
MTLFFCVVSNVQCRTILDLFSATDAVIVALSSIRTMLHPNKEDSLHDYQRRGREGVLGRAIVGNDGRDFSA